MVTVVAVLVGITACASRAEARAARPHVHVADSAFEFTLDDIHGKPYDFAQHSGKVLLIVNVASKCGFTPQYKSLQALYDQYRERGLVIIGIPANDFLWQESGSNDQIAQFCSTTYGVTFPMMAKVEVTGDGQHPLYWWLTEDSAKPGPIRWNFTKFLIGRDGRVVERFGPSTAPDDTSVINVIETALAASVALNYQTYEESIIKVLTDKKVFFTAEEKPKCEIGLAKYMSAKILKSTDGMVIVVGKITEWEGVVPPSGVDLLKDGKVIGYQVNNMGSSDNGENIMCFINYGDIEGDVKNALLTVIQQLK